jgi:serine/threonine protein kinase
MAASSFFHEQPPKFNNWELKDYGEKTNILGKGSYGTVYETTENYAIKEIFNEGELYSDMLNEIVYPSGLHHEGVIKYHDIFIDENNISIVMDKADGDLSKLKGKLDRNQFKSLAFQLITTLAYLTSRNIIHRDIKPQNIFYKECSDNNYKCIIGDFGIATGRECLLYTDVQKVYSLPYRPLEVILGLGKYTSKADVWALGCTLYELYTGDILFKGSDERHMFSLIAGKIGGFNRESYYYDRFQSTVDRMIINVNTKDYEFVKDPEINDLLIRMIVPDPDLRESIFTLQYHSFFKDVTDMCYSPFRIEANQCIDRVKLFDRDIDTTIDIKNTDLLLKLKYTYDIPSDVISLAFELIFEYLKTEPPTKNYEFEIYTGVYLASSFLDKHREEFIVKDILIDTPEDFEMFEDFILDFIKIINYDLIRSTQNDKILSYLKLYDDDIIENASNILSLCIPMKNLYFHEKIAEICILLSIEKSKRHLSPLYKNNSAYLNIVENTLEKYYKKFPELYAQLF